LGTCGTMMPVDGSAASTAWLTPVGSRWRRVEGNLGVDLSLSQNVVDSHTVIEVRGDVDVHSAPALRDRLIQALDGGQPVVILDLTQLQFIDSTGLGALVAAQNHAKETGTSFRVACAIERVLKLFRITELNKVFAIYPTVPLAIAAGEESAG